MKKAISLLSGGLDSFVSTTIARKKHNIILALTFDYGQRAALRETQASERMCRLWDIEHKVIKLPWLKEITKTALVNKMLDLPPPSPSPLPRGERGRGEGRATSDACPPKQWWRERRSAKAVWVPNRNLVFISIAAAFAESLKAELVIAGFNKEEAVTFLDNSQRFVLDTNKTLKYSTLNHPKVVSYTQKMSKCDIVRYATHHKLPLDLCWPCYEGGKKLCGRCESCVRFYRAMLSAKTQISHQPCLLKKRMGYRERPGSQ